MGPTHGTKQSTNGLPYVATSPGDSAGRLTEARSLVAGDALVGPLLASTAGDTVDTLLAGVPDTCDATLGTEPRAAVGAATDGAVAALVDRFDCGADADVVATVVAAGCVFDAAGGGAPTGLVGGAAVAGFVVWGGCTAFATGCVDDFAEAGAAADAEPDTAGVAADPFCGCGFVDVTTLALGDDAVTLLDATTLVLGEAAVTLVDEATTRGAVFFGAAAALTTATGVASFVLVGATVVALALFAWAAAVVGPLSSCALRRLFSAMISWYVLT